MLTLTFKHPSNTEGGKKKTSHKVAGLFLFVSVFTVTNAHADSKQDIAELEAFYEQVFGTDKQPVKHKTNQPLNRKNPELVAFYNDIFGKDNTHNKLKTKTRPQFTAKLAVSNKTQEPLTKVKAGSVEPSKEAKLQGLIDDVRKSTFRPLFNEKAPIKKDPELVAFYESVFASNNKKEKSAARTSVLEQTIEPKVANQQELVTTQAQINKLANQNYKESPETELQALIDKEKALVQSAETTKSVASLNKVGSNKLVSESNQADISTLYSQAFSDSQSIKKQAKPQQKKVSDLDALFAKAFGKKAVLSGLSQVSVDLRISKRTLGDVTVFTGSQGRLDRVGTKQLLKLLKKVLKEHVLKRVEKEISQKEKVSFEGLSSVGVGASYNSVELSLDLEIEPELRKPLILSMGVTRKASVRTENKLTADDISAYLNMYTNVSLNSGESKPRINAKLEGSINIKNVVLESTGNINAGIFSSNRTTLTYDNPEKLQRFTLGDVSTGGTNFQQSLNIKGLRISKEFFMEPDLQIRPSANESIILDSDSEVEVFINNQLRDRFYLRAGIYSLEDIGLYNGANNIRVRIKDKFGKITVKTSQQYFDAHLLKKGLGLYALTVGYLSNKQKNEKGELENTPIISAYYRKGVTKTLTMGIDAQISSDSYLLGSEVIAPLTKGTIKTGIAFSGGAHKDSGMAARFEFKPNRQPETIGLDTLRHEMLGLQKSGKGFLNNWTVSGEVQSRKFSFLNSTEPSENVTSNIKKQLKARLQTNFSFDISQRWRGALNLGVTDYYDAKESVSASLNATRRFDNGMSLRLGTRYDSEDDYSMNLQLSIPIFKEKGKRRKSLALRADTKNNSLNSKVSISPTGFVGKNSLSGSLEYTQSDELRKQDIEINYRNTNFETNFSASNLSSIEKDDTAQELNIGFNTSLACVGKKCATSYPIHDSFALVSGPSNQERPIALNNNNNRFIYSDENDSGLPDSYSALISSKNRNAVVNLESYKFQNINIDESTLPDGYDTEKTEFEVFPRYHQGFLIKAGGEPATILDGILVNQDKKPLGFKGGQWVPANGSGKTIAFFSNKAGRFRINSVPAGNYKLELFDYPAMENIVVAVPDLKGNLHDLGNIRIIE